MLSTKINMVILSERMLPSLEIEQVVSIITAICPYLNKDCVFEENVKITPSENSTGWFFECNKCDGAKCKGFFRDD